MKKFFAIITTIVIAIGLSSGVMADPNPNSDGHANINATNGNGNHGGGNNGGGRRNGNNGYGQGHDHEGNNKDGDKHSPENPATL